MAVIRPAENYDNTSNLIASLGVVCGLATIVLMLKFRGFKASLNLGSGRRKDEENYHTTEVTGAYRPNREEFFGYGSLAEPPKKLTPAMVVLPPSRSAPPPKPSRSATDLTALAAPPAPAARPALAPPPAPAAPPALAPPPTLPLKSSPNISRDPRGRTTSARDSVDLRTIDVAQLNIKEKAKKKQKKPAPDPAAERQRKLQEKAQRDAEKQRERAAKEAEKQRKIQEKEQKKRAAQEEKQRREREKLDRRKKTRAPAQPPPLPTTPPPQSVAPNYATNTLDSSISRSTAPPPYSEAVQVIPNTRDDTGNTSFAKKEDSGSWDLVSQHRAAMRGVAGGGGRPRQLKMDLGYNVAQSKVENSDA